MVHAHARTKKYVAPGMKVFGMRHILYQQHSSRGMPSIYQYQLLSILGPFDAHIGVQAGLVLLATCVAIMISARKYQTAVVTVSPSATASLHYVLQ